MTAKILPLFPDALPLEPRIVVVDEDGDVPHHDIGYAPARPRPVISDGKPRCRKCNELPPNGVLHGMGDRPERAYCGACVGERNRRRTR